MNQVWTFMGSLGIFAACLMLTVLAGLIGLPLLGRLSVGQTVRDDGPKTHYVKSGTPTFGGFFFLVPLVLVTVVVQLLFGFSSAVLAMLLLILAFGFAGFLDDYIKVRISKKGLSVRQKTVLLLAFSIGFALWYLLALARSNPFPRSYLVWARCRSWAGGNSPMGCSSSSICFSSLIPST